VASETHIPLRQRSAKAQAEAGVLIPYWHPADRDDEPLNWHLTVVVLPMPVLRRLVVAARKMAATTPHLRNPLDNRTCLDYPAMPREMVAFCRHSLINRTPTQMHMLNGYSGSYDNLLHKIERKGIDVAARQLDLRLAVLRLIGETYSELALECAEQAFHARRTYLENPQ
jgi:hypothetical protein